MKKILLFAPFAVIFAFAILHRGGISLHSHLAWAALLIIPAGALLLSKMPQMQTNLKRSLMYASLILFIATVVLSIKFSQASSYGLYEFLAYLSGATTFIIASNIYFDEKTIGKIFGALCAVAGLIGFAGLIFYMALPPPRMFGTFIGWDMISVSFPNAFALFLLMIIPITIYKLLNSPAESIKLYFIAGAVQFAAFILTFSRGSWLMLIIGAILACLMAIKSKKAILKFSAKRIVPVLLIAIILAYLATTIRSLKYETPSIYKKITFQADEEKISYTSRIDMFAASLKTIKIYPLIGEGPGVFQEKFDNHQHNLFLKIANDSGLAALLFFLIFLTTFAFAVKSNWKNIAQNLRWPTVVLTSSIGLALAHNMIDYNLNFVSTSLIFWFFLGIIASMISRKKFAFGRTTNCWKNIYVALAVLLSASLFAISIHEGFYKISYAEGKSLFKEKQYENALEKFNAARNLIFKHDLNNLIAESYLRLAAEKGWNPWGKRGLDFLAELPEKEKTMKTFVLSSELCLLAESTDCLDWALPSLKNINIHIRANLDPNKNIRPLYNYYYALYKAEKHETLKSAISAAEAFLTSYKSVVERNEHLTITTENPMYALKIYELFIDFAKEAKFDQKKINELTIAKVRLSRAINREKKKYENMYNTPFAKDEHRRL